MENSDSPNLIDGLLDGVEIDHKDFVGHYKGLVPKDLCEKLIELYEQIIAMPNHFVQTRTEQTKNRNHMIMDESYMFDSLIYGYHDLSGAMHHFHGEDKLIPRLFAAWHDWVDRYDVMNGNPWLALHYKFQRTRPKDGSGYHVWHSENSSMQHANRFGAWILYLNDVEEGGETELLYYGARYKPVAGDMIVWPAGFTHTHRGNPPISGEKNILTGWLEMNHGL